MTVELTKLWLISSFSPIVPNFPIATVLMRTEQPITVAYTFVLDELLHDSNNLKRNSTYATETKMSGFQVHCVEGSYGNFRTS